MAPPKFRVLVVGGGIGGLSIGLMLERAGIDYTILESRDDVRPLGAALHLGPSIMIAMEQLGLHDDISRNSIPLHYVTLMDEHLQRIYRIDTLFSKERYGYHSLNILRPALYEILMSKIPAYKILYGKKVIHVAQNDEGVLIRCHDGSTFYGDIVIGADGGESFVRELMFAELRAQGKLPAQDQLPKQSEQRCMVGITNPLDPERFPILKATTCDMHMVMPKAERTMIWYVPMRGNRFGWGITSSALHYRKAKSSRPSNSGANAPSGGSSKGGSAPSSKKGANDGHAGAAKTLHGRSSIESIQSVSSPIRANATPKTGLSIPSGAMGSISGPLGGATMGTNALSSHTSTTVTKEERIWHQLMSADDAFDPELRDQASPFGGTLGDLMDQTPRGMISEVTCEEKLYQTWYHGRIVLMGDSCHPMVVSSGYGATLAILDAVALSSLLSELPTNDQRDIERLFQIYHERQTPNVRVAMLANRRQSTMLFDRGLNGRMSRKVASSFVSGWMMGRVSDMLYGYRPQLSFLKPLPDLGIRKTKAIKMQTLTMEDRRFDATAAGADHHHHLLSSSHPTSSRQANGTTMSSTSTYAGSQSTTSSADSLNSSGSAGSAGVGRRGRRLAMGIISRIMGGQSSSSTSASAPSSSSSAGRDRDRDHELIQDAISNYGSYYGVDFDRNPTPSPPPPKVTTSSLQSQQQHKLQRRLSSPPSNATPASMDFTVAPLFDYPTNVLAPSQIIPTDDLMYLHHHHHHHRHPSQHSHHSRTSSLGRTTKPTIITDLTNGILPRPMSHHHHPTLPEGEELHHNDTDDWTVPRQGTTTATTYDERLQRHRRHRSRPPPPHHNLGDDAGGGDSDGPSTNGDGSDHRVPFDEDRLFYSSWSTSPTPLTTTTTNITSTSTSTNTATTAGPKSASALDTSSESPFSFSIPRDAPPLLPRRKSHPLDELDDYNPASSSLRPPPLPHHQHHDDEMDSHSIASSSASGGHTTPTATSTSTSASNRTSKLLRPFLSSFPVRRGLTPSSPHHLHNNPPIENNAIGGGGGSSIHSGSHISTHSASLRPSPSSTASTTAPSTPAVSTGAAATGASPPLDYFLSQEYPPLHTTTTTKSPPPLVRARSDHSTTSSRRMYG